MLGVCASCGRHARESVCPFCGATIRSTTRAPLRRASRTAKILGVAALGVACGGTTNPSDAGSDAKEDVTLQPPYGAVIPDAGPDVAQPPDAGDASTDAADDSSGVPLYGAPPPRG